jgi:hypothetical protein
MIATGAANSGKGSNSVQVRHYNERVVLAAIRTLGEASKADVARFAHLTPPAISGIIDALVEAGYVSARGKRFGGKGQPSLLYGLNPKGGYSIGLHIGRRTLDAVLLDFAGTVITFESHEYDFPVPAHIQAIGNDVISRFRAIHGSDGGGIVGMGISAPYFLGGWERELGFPAEVSARWREIDLTSSSAPRAPCHSLSKMMPLLPPPPNWYLARASGFGTLCICRSTP